MKIKFLENGRMEEGEGGWRMCGAPWMVDRWHMALANQRWGPYWVNN